MNELPRAHVIRGGGEGERGPRSAEAHVGSVLRLQPRAVPRGLQWRLLFGGPLALFGWLFAAFGMAFVLFFLPHTDFGLASYDADGVATITGVEATNSSENEQPIYRVRYTFVDEAGTTRQGASYTKDPSVRGSWSVEYQRDDPSSSQLAGMRQHAFGWWLALFIFVFPIVGLAIALPQIPRGRRAIRLLRHGVETCGTLTKKQETKVSVNDVPVMALTFKYEADGRTYHATMKTLQPALLEDDKHEPMLYDPAEPEHATTLDHLPGAPKIGPDGELVASGGIGLHLLILPALFVALAVATAAAMLAR